MSCHPGSQRIYIYPLIMQKTGRTSLIPITLIVLLIACFCQHTLHAQNLSQSDAATAMKHAVDFFRKDVGYHGAYLYQYSADLTKQEGERQAYKSTGWTQPPGTPAVGEAYLDAYLLTSQQFLLDAARETGLALVKTQLRSGGWDSRIELDPKHRTRYAYRTDPESKGQRNYSTLDDNKTQSALLFLMHLDEALKFQDDKIHECVEYACEHLLAAQYPNGAWPQQFDAPPDPKNYPVKKASYPTEWSRTYNKRDYRGDYTFNDGLINDLLDVLLEGHRIYGKSRFMKAAEKTGDFALLAQLPMPQPGWAQQYNADMHPSWARKFEPPSITGLESQGVMFALLTLYRVTGKEKYLQPIPFALKYYKQSLLPDGRLARFYELQTNKPLFFTKSYDLTYSDSDLPTHYGFKVKSKLDRIQNGYDKLKARGPDRNIRKDRIIKAPKMSRTLEKQAAKIVAELDDRGAWVEAGRMRTYGSNDKTSQVITAKRFIYNLNRLSQFVAAAR